MVRLGRLDLLSAITQGSVANNKSTSPVQLSETVYGDKSIKIMACYINFAAHLHLMRKITGLLGLEAEAELCSKAKINNIDLEAGIFLSYQHVRNAFKRCSLGCLPLFFIPGLLLLATGFSKVIPWGTTHWRKAHGTITSFDGGGPYETKEGTQFGVIVGYYYIVDNVTYNGDVFNLEQLNDDKPELVDTLKFQELAGEYPVGKSVTVYYDAANLSESVLELNYGTLAVLMQIGGILCVCGTIIAMVVRMKNLP